ncbi:hypothetical protein [Paraburkholderia phosphatilytica]|uniref:hypothetical protein n=1 Tax=Paraburkholderia phosphatilytica TaxID=2282883 RepID=UPI000E504190|nr:hypothetical protein [Paraburkholderia phosphatilytica]
MTRYTDGREARADFYDPDSGRLTNQTATNADGSRVQYGLNARGAVAERVNHDASGKRTDSFAFDRNEGNGGTATWVTYNPDGSKSGQGECRRLDVLERRREWTEVRSNDEAIESGRSCGLPAVQVGRRRYACIRGQFPKVMLPSMDVAALPARPASRHTAALHPGRRGGASRWRIPQRTHHGIRMNAIARIA